MFIIFLMIHFYYIINKINKQIIYLLSFYLFILQTTADFTNKLWKSNQLYVAQQLAMHSFCSVMSTSKTNIFQSCS